MCLFVGGGLTDSTCWISYTQEKESSLSCSHFSLYLPLVSSTSSPFHTNSFWCWNVLTSERPEGSEWRQDIHAEKLLRAFIYRSFEVKTSLPLLWWRVYITLTTVTEVLFPWEERGRDQVKHPWFFKLPEMHLWRGHWWDRSGVREKRRRLNQNS